MDLDTHCVIFDNLDLTELTEIVDSSLLREGFSYDYRVSKVLESKNSPIPYIILTSDASNLKELKKMHDDFLMIFRQLGIRTLIESEHNFDIDSLISQQFQKLQGSDESEITIVLDNVNRDSLKTLHWGDIHIDIPNQSDTEAIRQVFDELGFSYIVTSKKEKAKTVVTTQIQYRELLASTLQLTCKVLKDHLFNADSFKIKAERLLFFDATFDAKPLPMTVGLKDKNLLYENNKSIFDI